MFTEGAEVRASQLYLCYEDWTVENGLKYMSGRAFGLEMRKRLNWIHRNAGTFYQGLVLQQESNWEEQDQTRPVSLETTSGRAVSNACQPDDPPKSDRSDRCDGTFKNLSFVSSLYAQRKDIEKIPSLLSLSLSDDRSESALMQPLEPDKAIFYEHFSENDPSLFCTTSVTYEEFYL